MDLDAAAMLLSEFKLLVRLLVSVASSKRSRVKPTGGPSASRFSLRLGACAYNFLSLDYQAVARIEYFKSSCTRSRDSKKVASKFCPAVRVPKTIHEIPASWHLR